MVNDKNPVATNKIEMEYGCNRQSKRAARKAHALWRMVDAKRETGRHLAALKRRNTDLNLDNKPLGA